MRIVSKSFNTEGQLNDFLNEHKELSIINVETVVFSSACNYRKSGMPGNRAIGLMITETVQIKLWYRDPLKPLSTE